VNTSHRKSSRQVGRPASNPALRIGPSAFSPLEMSKSTNRIAALARKGAHVRLITILPNPTATLKKIRILQASP